MATNDWTSSSYPGYSEPEQKLGNDMVVISRYFDCSSVNMTGSDVYQVFSVPTGCTPIRFIINVATAEGGAATLDIGDGGSTARFETDANLNSVAITGTAPDAYHIYTEDDTIDIIPSADLDAAKFTITVIYAISKLS